MAELEKETIVTWRAIDDRMKQTDRMKNGTLKVLEAQWGITCEALSPVDPVENPPGFPKSLCLSQPLLSFSLSFLCPLLPFFSVSLQSPLRSDTAAVAASGLLLLSGDLFPYVPLATDAGRRSIPRRIFRVRSDQDG